MSDSKIINTNDTNNPPKIIKKETIKRLISDVKTLIRNPLSDNGIHYKHDEEDMMKGYALIFGPSDTPYSYGNYLFELLFPADYPHSPPHIVYSTNGDGIRFNPNLYTNGKVCISLLNTWRGDQWTSCQTISTVLLTLCSLLNNTPLLNEPGIGPNHRDYVNYNLIIGYKNIEIAIMKMVLKDNHIFPSKFESFHSLMEENLKEKYPTIVKYLEDKVQLYPIAISAITDLYHMNVMIDYNKLHSEFINKIGTFIHNKNKLN